MKISSETIIEIAMNILRNKQCDTLFELQLFEGESISDYTVTDETGSMPLLEFLIEFAEELRGDGK